MQIIALDTQIYQCSGSTKCCLDFSNENIKKLNEIISINVFFNNFDAILAGYYKIEDSLILSINLKNVSAYHFITRDINGDEIRLSSCNCGYNGEGPRGTKTILSSTSVPDGLINTVFSSESITFNKINENGEWIAKSIPRKAVNLDSVSGYVYYNMGKLVLLQHRNSFIHL